VGGWILTRQNPPTRRTEKHNIFLNEIASLESDLFPRVLASDFPSVVPNCFSTSIHFPTSTKIDCRCFFLSWVRSIEFPTSLGIDSQILWVLPLSHFNWIQFLISRIIHCCSRHRGWPYSVYAIFYLFFFIFFPIFFLSNVFYPMFSGISAKLARIQNMSAFAGD